MVTRKRGDAGTVAPFGAWKSSISAAMVAGGSLGLDQISLDRDELYWVERRPEEGGRQVIVRLGRDGVQRDVTPAPFNARTRIHEYGGQCYAVADGVVVFSNLADGRLYAHRGDAPPRPITPEGLFRYGDLSVVPGGWVVCVREDCRGAEGAQEYLGQGSTGAREPVDAIVCIDVDCDSQHGDCFAGDSSLGRVVDGPARNDDDPREAPGPADEDAPRVRVLVEGSDFYGAPRVSPDGRKLAWLAWNHPNMPWDGTELWVGELLADGTIGDRRRAAGGSTESVFQPEWSPDGILHFVSDRSGWWNLYRLRGDRAEALHPMAAEFGVPAWVLGLRTYDFAGPGEIVCTYCENGAWRLALLNTGSKEFETFPLAFTSISGVRATGNWKQDAGSRKQDTGSRKLEAGSEKPEAGSRKGEGDPAGAPRGAGSAWFVASSPVEAAALVRLGLGTREVKALRRSGAARPDPAVISSPQAIEFATERGLTAHATFYPPRNEECVGPPGQLPPLLVACHGGPTDAVSPGLSLSTQFWTSRGFAVVQINYGGSSGYGRSYRERLNGQWGVVDVEDCVNAARWLASRGWVDGDRMAIRGSSAGGYTALRALATHDLFRAGAIYYGVSDLEMLAQETPKFESRYHLRLVGPYPEGRALYRERSPIHSPERISAALIFFQGLDDSVVLPAQSEAMHRAAAARGLPTAYLTFEGEGHGFRRAETIRQALEAELYFYSRVFGFETAEPVDPIAIDNL